MSIAVNKISVLPFFARVRISLHKILLSLSTELNVSKNLAPIYLTCVICQTTYCIAAFAIRSVMSATAIIATNPAKNFANSIKNGNLGRFCFIVIYVQQPTHRTPGRIAHLTQKELVRIASRLLLLQLLFLYDQQEMLPLQNHRAHHSHRAKC